MRTEKINIPLKLTSNGELVLHFIGTGSAFTKKNFQNNLIIIKGNNHLVVDFGTKASQGLFEKGVKTEDIQGYLITHTHADHIGSLEEAALLGRYFTKRKPDLIIPKILEKILWNNGLKAGIAFNEDPPLTLKDLFNIIYPRKVTKDRYGRLTYHIKYKGIDLLIFKTNHIPSNGSLSSSIWTSGIIIDERILFTADTKFDPELLETFDKFFNIELIIHDCQFFTGGVHAGYDELKTLPERLKKKMLLSHYADNWQNFHPENDGFIGFTKPDLLYIFD